MPITPEARQRLATRMEERRRELRLRWQDVAEDGQVSLKTLHSVRVGTGGIAALTETGIEDGLHWPRGTVARILDDPGFEPREPAVPVLPVPPPEPGRTAQPTLRILQDPAIDETELARELAILDDELARRAPARNQDEAKGWALEDVSFENRKLYIAVMRIVRRRSGAEGKGRRTG